MKMLAALVGLVVAALALSSEGLAAKGRGTHIYFTRNTQWISGQPNTGIPECLAAVATERIPALKNDDIEWKVKNGHGATFSNPDKCPDLDKSQVELHFKTDVMGAAAMRKLKSNANGDITGTVSMDSGEARKGLHGYQVFYKGLPAGPDPEIDVDCDGCGPGGR